MRTTVGSTILTLLLLTSGCVQVVSPPSPAASLSPTATITQTAVPPTSTKETSPSPEPTETPQPTAIPTLELTPTIPPTPTPEPTRQPVEQVEMVAEENIDVYLGPGENRVGYFVPGQRFIPTGVEQDGWIQVTDQEGRDLLWIQEGSSYEPYVEEALCQVPHFPDRTSDRKTGYIDFFGRYMQEILPDDPYVMRWVRIGGDTFVYKRDARIVAIDRENSIISLQLEGGVIIQREFRRNTVAIMIAHEFRSPMPTERAYQQGGNICDLEEGDFVSLIHPNEAEAANPNPNVIDLWGVRFVQ